MLGKIYTDAKLRMGSTLREWKEKREEKKAASTGRVKALQDGKEIGFDRNPRRIRFAVMLATWGVLGFLVLWVMQTVGEVRLFVDLDMKWGEPIAFDYDFAFAGDILSLIVLTIVSFAIVLFSKTWVSFFMDTPWSEWGSKLLSFTLGVGGSFAIIMGGLEVNQHIRQEDFRGALVEEQSAGQSRAALQAQITSIEQRLASMRDQQRVGVYAAIAASVGAAAYDSDYLSDEALARTEPSRRDLVRRARGAAVAADALEAQKLQLAMQLATATPEAATAAAIVMTDPVSNFINGLGPWRIVLMVLVGDMILLFGTYLADRREERLRYAGSTAASGWADEGHRIEDLRGQDIVDRDGNVKQNEPMKPTREVVTDAETGEELIRITPKPHWRKQKGKKQRVETNPDIPPDETGVPQDGGNRTAVTLAGEMELPESVVERIGEEEHPASDPEGSAAEQQAKEDQSSVQPEPSEAAIALQDLSEELPVFEDEPNTQTQDQEQEQREPQTNPARLIAAE